MGHNERIRRARSEEAEQLSGLARRSKAHWGYDAEFLRRAAVELTITPRAITDHQVWVLEHEGRIIILGRTAAALRQAGVSQEEIDTFFAEATSGDYDHLLQTTMAWVDWQ